MGGSILNHEHFQGGRYVFAMEKAQVETPLRDDRFPDVRAGIVKWPMSDIRLTSSDRRQLAGACAAILEKGRGYSDAEVGIYSQTGGVLHNTVTPIARKSGDSYVCDLVLRNNITSEERPLGVFHPSPSLHHIKKENIGLIEVMGLAVLPGRLERELDMLESAMLAGRDIRGIQELEQHADWAENILQGHPEFSEINGKYILEQETGRVFLNVLEDSGVFKRDKQGADAFLKFAESSGMRQ